jgi:KDO2-lipid IV(A) lauroyltransferase
MTTAVILLAKGTARLPLPACRALGRFLGWVAYTCVPRVRKVAPGNLDLAYGDTLTPAEKRRIALGAAQNACIVGAEFSHLPRLFDQTIPKWIALDGIEHLKRDQGVLLIGAHLGNWEWMPSVLCRLGFKVAAVVRPLDDPRLNDYVDGIRRSCGVKTIEKDGSGRELMRLLKEGYVVGLLADQSMRESALPATFFGHPCWTTIGPAMIVIRAKVRVHAMFLVRDATGQYAARITPSLESELTGDFQTDLARITQRCQDAIEQEVRKNPEQWLWLHRRWKERPKLQEEWAARMAKVSPKP